MTTEYDYDFYIEVLDHLRGDNDLDKKALVNIKDYLEDELKDDPRMSALLNRNYKCVITDDTSKIKEAEDTDFTEHTPDYDILDKVSTDYELLMTNKLKHRKKTTDFCVYLRVFPRTGHFYIGFSKRTPTIRHKEDINLLKSDIGFWARNGYTTILQDTIKNLILEGTDPQNTFKTTILFSLDTALEATRLEEYIIKMIGMNRVSTMNPEKMLNIEHRHNSKQFTYEDIYGTRFTYVNDNPMFYKVKTI